MMRLVVARWDHMSWNKDDITDFADELDRHRDAIARGESPSLSDECYRFVRCWTSHDLPDDQIKFFESTLLSLTVRHVVEL